MNKRVILGMSGGMDSSMSAVLLLRQGYEVIGATLQTHTEADDKNILDAQKLAQSLNIEHHLIDCRDDFKKEVIHYFADEYLNGRTPNPCVYCNQTIKWKYLLELATKLNCDYIATGHYVRVIQENNHFYIQKGIDSNKDQSYFLWNLSQEVLSKAIFPLGQLKKSEVRDLASELGYQNIADKKESMGVCFLAGTDYREYLKKLLKEDHPSFQPGPVLDLNNKTLGHHDGFPFYTIGQRRGIEGVANGKCVVKIDPVKKALIAGSRDDLYTNNLVLKEYSLTPNSTLWQDREVFIRVRGYDSVPGYQGTIAFCNEGLDVQFNENVWAVTPGQSIVFYQDDKLIGGGIL
ncbi:tRNA 2-thiouridine(34) synthase MnmA [Carboxylicivirga caseinilyticus]|uniref:tRNA 2-thiouridine(34) synthase MnmA n=1 Tax=Carboxylicivirga caseinilyticus TaxID=3417572 RepID=UPI003D33CB03|nr:tRNA 2-thiouridine(34) synthase MnmA [Marinilabiliaceae bacterium A049]